MWKPQIDVDAKHIQVEYNELGYPDSIFIIMNNGMAYDVRISEFQGGAHPQGLSSGIIVSTRTADVQELASGEARWKSHALENYRYKYQCYGSNPHNIVFPWIVTVSDNEATGTDGNDNPINSEPHPHTVEDLCQRIRQAYSDDVAHVVVRYNDLYGFPEDIFIVYNDEIADATYECEIYDFEVL